MPTTTSRISEPPTAELRAARRARGWTQQELARRSGVSRQVISAIESGGQQPGVSAAIGLARALGTTVEALFDPDTRVSPPIPDTLGDAPLTAGTAVSIARVGARQVAVPWRGGLVGGESWAVADAVVDEHGLSRFPEDAPADLLLAGCDPILGMLAGLTERRGRHRILTTHASTQAAMDALRAGKAHGALVHGPTDSLPVPPRSVRRWHVTRWQVGLASTERRPADLDQLVETGSAVIQRDPGASSQQTLRTALARIGAERLAGPVADGHLDVARRVAHGDALTGLTIEAAAHAFDLAFAPLATHGVELWIDERWVSTHAAADVLDTLRGTGFANRAAHLAGYDLHDCGVERVPR